MGEPLIEFNYAIFTAKLAAWAEYRKISMREALYEEWPLLIRKIMDFTPPFAPGGGAGGLSSGGGSDLAVGRAAVNRDIRKTMRPFNPATRSRRLEKIITDRNIKAFNLMASRVKSGPMAGARAVAFSPAVHKSQRNARGRVGKVLGNVVLGSDVGLLKKYIALVQSRVGFAKSGWLKALLLAGGEAPAFVARQGTGGGDVSDHHADPEDPHIIAMNRTPWAVRRDEGERIIKAAHASRGNAIIKKIAAKQRQAIKQANLEIAAA